MPNFSVQNPVLDLDPQYSVRDPALLWDGSVFHCFFTIVENTSERMMMRLGHSTSQDFVHWQDVRVLADGPENFSSPGNALRVGEEWILCLQSYPPPPDSIYGGDDSRLWLMRSRDLVSWDKPQLIRAEGCTASWNHGSRRQIDPYLVHWKEKFWCLYKNSGCLGILSSPDLLHWEEASPGHPVLSPEDTPDGATVENPCVIETPEGFALFFAPCRKGRGIGLAYSDDLITWRDVHYLDFPPTPWADGGPTAAMVLDMRRELGAWIMAFHGDRGDRFGAAMGIAFSRDLEHWESAMPLEKK